MITRFKAPLDVQIELTERCNHSCGYCYNFFGHKISENYITTVEIERVVNQLSDNGVFDVILTGGEPFLNPKVLFSAITLLRKKGINSYLNTNLSLPISEEESKRLSGLNLLLVSFPSLDEGTFNEITRSKNYIRVIKNLERLSKNGINLAANQVVTKRNLEDVYRTGKFLFERFGIKKFSATPVNPSRIEHKPYEISEREIIQTARTLIELENELGLETDMLDCFPTCFFPEELRYHRITKHGCSAGKMTLVIGARGGVRRCTRLEKTYGNILTEDFSGIWERMMERKNRVEECERCANNNVCYGGCESRALLNFGKDFLIRSEIEEVKKERMTEKKVYKIRSFRSRKESNREILITDGKAIIIGNENLLKFMEKMKGKKFDLEEIRARLGVRGESLIRYLYDLGMLENAI